MKLGSRIRRLLQSLRWLAPIMDVLLSPITLVAALWFRLARYWGVKNHRLMNKIFLKFGVFPIVDHYYEPLFDYRKIPVQTSVHSHLNFCDPAQLNFLSELSFSKELMQLPRMGISNLKFYYENGSFPSGDAELYYSIIRKLKPRTILEIGSGFSTLMAIEAMDKNRLEESSYNGELICIEPYEMPQLERLKIELIRSKVEEVADDYFRNLEVDDILFIDSSHIIRPGGDVNHIILKILPILRPGVWVHFHDIFTPYEYPMSWLKDEFRMWNEQFLLEAFLLGNQDFEIVCSLNYLKHKYWKEVSKAFPVLGQDKHREPGSFWIKKKTSKLGT